MDFPMYTLTDLGALAGSLFSDPTDVSTPSGPEGVRIAGYSTSDSLGTLPDGSSRRATLWTQLDDGSPPTTIDLDPPAGFSQALGLNNNDPPTVVGWRSADGLLPVGVVWYEGERYDAGVSELRDVSDSGVAVGWSIPFEIQLRHAQAVVAAVPPGGIDYDLLPGSDVQQFASDAYRINQQGLVVGWATWPTVGGPKQAFAWDIGAQNERIGDPDLYRPLQDLTDTGATSFAFGVNDAGQIVGMYKAGDFVWGFQADKYGNRTWPDPGHPGDPPKYNFTCWSPLIPLDINNAGVIVGTCAVEYKPYPQTPRMHGFISVAGEEAVSADLNTRVTGVGAGWELFSANAINDRGEIVGNGVDPSARLHAFLLTPQL